MCACDSESLSPSKVRDLRGAASCSRSCGRRQKTVLVIDAKRSGAHVIAMVRIMRKSASVQRAMVFGVCGMCAREVQGAHMGIIAVCAPTRARSGMQCWVAIVRVVVLVFDW